MQEQFLKVYIYQQVKTIHLSLDMCIRGNVLTHLDLS